MKKKITALLVILAIMAAVPLFSNLKSIKFPKDNPKNLTKTEIITRTAANNFRKHYCRETIKALVLILNSNYKAGALDKNDMIKKSDFIKKFRKGKEYYSLIENTVKENADNCISYKGKAASIPYFKVSKGYTDSSKKYPYLKACACPWDTRKKDFKNSEKTVGISINTLDKLCAMGLDYKSAVDHFMSL